MWRPFLVLVLSLSFASSTKWFKIDTNEELKCTAPPEEKVLSCAWRSPTMENAKTGNLEDTRLEVETLGNECVVKIDKVHEKDEGTWLCEFLYHKENVARTEKKNFSVSIANFSMDAPIITLSQSDEKNTDTYTCIYESSPPATFTWYINDTVQSTKEATLTLESKKYINSTLKCEVDFKKYDLTDTFNVTHLIGQTPKENDGGSKHTDDATDTMDASTKTIIGVIAGMLGICLIIVVLYSCGCLKNPRKSDDTDAETGTSDSLPMKESTETEKSDDETEKADSTKDEKEKLNEAVKETFGDRLASFFRINKSFNMDDEKVNDEDKKNNDDELQKVVIDNAGDNKEQNGDMDKTDSKTVLTEVSLETEKAETEEPEVAKSKKGNGGNKLFAVFAKMFKPRSDAVADKSVADEENLVKSPEKEQEETKIEETEPLTDELEPEDKAEPIEEEDNNKKEPTPNTSF